MLDVTRSEAEVKLRCVRLVHDFSQEIIEEWKGWLTGSLPMAGIAVTSLVDPDWVRLPLWVWALLIFVGGLLLAMFRVYRDLRRERDALQERLGGIGIAGPFILVPFSGQCGDLCRGEAWQPKGKSDDL